MLILTLEFFFYVNKIIVNAKKISVYFQNHTFCYYIEVYIILLLYNIQVIALTQLMEQSITQILYNITNNINV